MREDVAMRLGKSSADSRQASVERVVKILEEYVGGLPVAGPDEPFVFVRTWTLTRTGSDAPLSQTAPATVPADVSFQVRCVVSQRTTEDDSADEVDDQRTYEQLIGAARALAANGFGTEEVFEGWRTVALEVALPSAARAAEAIDKAKKVEKAVEVEAEKAEKGEKKRRRGLRRPEPVSVS
ncbi:MULTISPECIES: hypothetical protein [unclassified Frankia]|uniref:hypothetical protein n=1 Tax=unclassified Frankia TaxID=2632575 RepID=UPI002AD51BCC|nr:MULTISPECIES: hypothetical protein [unclassified Frankia]